MIQLALHPGAPSEDQAEADLIRARERRHATSAPQVDGVTAQAPRGIDDDFIVFGYLQSESQVFHQRWHALTHVGSRFVGFDVLGNLTGLSAFTGRSSYLKAGGAAEAAGVKVILVLANFSDGNGGTIASVMTNPSRRANLIAQLVQTLSADSYAHGVSLDLEFSWGPTVRDGITTFCTELRAAFDAVNAEWELSIYTNAIFQPSQWDFDAQSGITPSIDYMLYSMYDWASGLTPRAISDFDRCLGSSRMHAYLNDGLPPEKLVPVVSAYSRRWSGTGAYGTTGSSPLSGGFTDARFDMTLRPGFGPALRRYERDDEAAWYTYNDGIQRVRTFDSVDSMELKIRHSLSMQDPSGTWNGRRLGGVGFWSLMWMAESTSIDPRTGSSVSRTRTYPQVYQLCHDIFARPGSEIRTLESFAGLDFRWRDPNFAPDTSGDFDADSTRFLVASPDGVGNALQCVFDFEASGSNRAVFAHEVLASPLAPQITDANATLANVPRGSRIHARISTNVAQPAYGLRLLVVDAQGQLESSPLFSLQETGVRTLTWDLNDATSVSPFNTSEPAFASGNGSIATTIGDSDVGIYGFVVEGTGAASGAFTALDISASPSPVQGRRYSINEFRYANSFTEFVEIIGPSGPVPFGLTVRVYDSRDGSIHTSLPVVGTIPSGQLGPGFNGKGVLVIGDPGVPNVSSSIGFAPQRDDLSNLDPGAIQLVDEVSGFVHDSVVFEAFGGLDDLTRSETRGVTGQGWPWLGEAADGRDMGGQAYTFGRYPDGFGSGRNAKDFSFQIATPGARNARALGLPATLDFEAAEPSAFQTYGTPSRANPGAAGLPASPQGGLAWRCVDPAGGGVIGVVGDAALGVARGHAASGEVYVPIASAPAQAIAVGLCGSQGSTFFSSTGADHSAYESGYWLIYESRAGVGLADGRPDHGGVWELVHATHDNMDGERVELLARISNGSLGVTPGHWTSFELKLRPYGNHDPLVVRVGGQEVYRGTLPDGGPTNGAFQVGFRENHAGPPSAAEGTWIDHLHIERVGPLPPLGLPEQGS